MEHRSDSEGHLARLAQLVERETFNLVVVGSSPTVGTRVVGLKQLGEFQVVDDRGSRR